MPSLPTSSMRPRNGETMYAPTSAARIAWAGEKTRVTLILMPPSAARRFPASRPSGVIGTFTTAFGAFCDRPTPSSYIASAAVSVVSKGDVAGHRLEDLLQTMSGACPLLATREDWW